MSPGIKNITLLAPGVGVSALIQDNYFILHMPVIKFSHRLGLLLALMGYLLTVQSVEVEIHGKSSQYYFGVEGGNGGGNFMARPDRPHYIWRLTSIYAVANSTSHFSRTTLLCAEHFKQWQREAYPG